MTAAPELIYLKAPNGQVIGMTLPLRASIDEQWQRGQLLRVNEDGSPFGESAAVILPDGESGEELTGKPGEDLKPPGSPASEQPANPHEPKRPSSGAHRKTWAEYAVATGRVSDGQAEGLSRAELMQLAAPDAASRKPS